MGRVQALLPNEVNIAIHNAKKAQVEWAELSMDERCKYLEKIADLIDMYADELTITLVKEIGKPKKIAEDEVLRTADIFRATAQHARSLRGELLFGRSMVRSTKEKVSLAYREPIGVVLCISPFNYPINLSGSKIAPALAMGNGVIFKPSTQGVISAIMFVKILEASGLPKGLVNLVTGRGSEIGDYLVSHEDIDMINFTGSSAVGKSIAKKAGMKRLLMELGGKDAAIVLNDADLDKAAKAIVKGAYSYFGERCTAVKRVIVVNSVADELVSRLKKLVNGLKVGDPIKENVDIGPLISDKAADYVDELIKDAKKQGAKFVCSGKREGRIIRPHLIDKVTKKMRIAWEEPFGPVLPVIRARNKDDAIKIANASEYGLQGSVFTESVENAIYVAKRLQTGTVVINDKSSRGPDNFPFQGIKDSGIGTQGIGYALEAHSRIKSIVMDFK